MNDYGNGSVGVYHLHDLGSQVIQEMDEEEAVSIMGLGMVIDASVSDMF